MSTEKNAVNLSTRIYLIIFSIMGVAVFAISFLVWSLYHLQDAHHHLLTGDVAEARLALQMEVELKKQVKEWDNLMLRGDDPAERKKYHDALMERHSRIDSMSSELRRMFEHANDQKDLKLLSEFDESHADMRDAFLAAEAQYTQEVESGNVAAGAAIIKADELTRGIDDVPTRDLEEITANLVAHTAQVDAELGGEISVFVTIVAIVLGFAAVIAFFFGRGISHKLANFVDRFRNVSEGDGDLTQRLQIDSGDELGQLAGHFNKLMGNLQELMKQVQLSGITVTSSSTEIAAGSREQEAAVAELAATAKEIAATTTEISATANELMQTMQDVSSVTHHTAQSAAQSKLGLENMERTMGQMVESAGTITNRLSVLSEKASNISSVVTTIMKVADQTNLLSLNAAIEAEKAGEFGLGFAVVANEVRRLADQTAMASTDIEQMVKEMQSAVSAAVMGMDGFAGDIRHGADDVRQVAGQLGGIIQQVQELVPRFENIKEGMAAQTSGAAQINEGVNMVVESSEQSAEALRQAGIAVNQLNEAASELQSAVGRFKISENGDGYRHDVDAARRRANEAALGSSAPTAGNRSAALEKIAQAQRQAQARMAQQRAGGNGGNGGNGQPQPAAQPAMNPQQLHAQQQAAARQAQATRVQQVEEMPLELPQPRPQQPQQRPPQTPGNGNPRA